MWANRTRSSRWRWQAGRLRQAKYPLWLTSRLWHRRWMGNSAFAASMNMNLIDFPPWRKSGGLLEDVALLAEHLVLATEALELVHDVLMGRHGRRRPCVLVLRHPARERRTVHAKIVGDRALGAPTRQNEANGLILKLSRKTGLRHGDPPASYRALHFFDASPIGCHQGLMAWTGRA